MPSPGKPPLTNRMLTIVRPNRQHYNKHRKPWVCELENCPNLPNKRRFARRDGLERHKQTVKHVPKGAEG